MIDLYTKNLDEKASKFFNEFYNVTMELIL